MMVAVYSCILAILWFGTKLIFVGEMQLGDLMSFITYVQQILMSLMMISMIFVMSVMARASMKRICEVLDEEPTIKDDTADENLKVENGDIEFKNVVFRYNETAEEPVLSNINIKIKSGETIGIIGGTGSSKSTFVQLIPRLYDVSEGCVKVGGVDVRD